MKFLFGFEPPSSILYFLLLLLISHTERLSPFQSLEYFKYLIIGFFFNKRDRREKLHPQGAIALLQCVRVIMGWGWAGEYQFQEEKLVFILASLWKVAGKLSQELQSYYGNGSFVFTL